MSTRHSQGHPLSQGDFPAIPKPQEWRNVGDTPGLVMGFHATLVQTYVALVFGMEDVSSGWLEHTPIFLEDCGLEMAIIIKIINIKNIKNLKFTINICSCL